jgi:hypothetical protein
MPHLFFKTDNSIVDFILLLIKFRAILLPAYCGKRLPCFSPGKLKGMGWGRRL